ncbi:MAG: hypothetical protein SH847_22330, partial [Roseiflexaceae bacterium]|nr:hypothetical protein [Roseiflexaceae bacterium]
MWWFLIVLALLLSTCGAKAAPFTGQMALDELTKAGVQYTDAVAMTRLPGSPLPNVYTEQIAFRIAVTGSCVVEPCNVVTSYTYDRAGNRTSITDANSHTRAAVFDAADRQIIARDPLNQETQWDYDQGNRITLQRDPRGTDFDLSYSYGELDRPTELSAIALTAPITTSYDLLGRRT